MIGNLPITLLQEYEYNKLIKINILGGEISWCARINTLIHPKSDIGFQMLKMFRGSAARFVESRGVNLSLNVGRGSFITYRNENFIKISVRLKRTNRDTSGDISHFMTARWRRLWLDSNL